MAYLAVRRDLLGFECREQWCFQGWQQADGPPADPRRAAPAAVGGVQLYQPEFCARRKTGQGNGHAPSAGFRPKYHPMETYRRIDRFHGGLLCGGVGAGPAVCADAELVTVNSDRLEYLQSGREAAVPDDAWLYRGLCGGSLGAWHALRVPSGSDGVPF